MLICLKAVPIDVNLKTENTDLIKELECHNASAAKPHYVAVAGAVIAKSLYHKKGDCDYGKVTQPRMYV